MTGLLIFVFLPERLDTLDTNELLLCGISRTPISGCAVRTGGSHIIDPPNPELLSLLSSQIIIRGSRSNAPTTSFYQVRIVSIVLLLCTFVLFFAGGEKQSKGGARAGGEKSEFGVYYSYVES